MASSAAMRLDAEKFETILSRHGLLEKWRKYQQDYPQP